MKKSIYFSGIVCANGMLLGCMFKIMHWPGAGIMLVLSVFLFCFYFLPFALREAYRAQESKENAPLFVITFVVFLISMMGVLFKVQHWPGASMFLLIGIPLPFVVFLPAYLFYTRKEAKTNTMNYLGIMFGLTFLAVFSVLLSLNVSKNVMERLESNFYSNQQAATVYRSRLEPDASKNRGNNYPNEFYLYLENMKQELLSASGNVASKTQNLQYGQMIQQDNADIPASYFYNSDGKTRMDELKERVMDYRTSLSARVSDNKALQGLVNSLFEVPGTENMKAGDQIPWENRIFPTYQLIVVLDALSRMQANILLVESELALGK